MKLGKPSGVPGHRFHGHVRGALVLENRQQWMAAMDSEEGWATLSTSWPGREEMRR